MAAADAVIGFAAMSALVVAIGRRSVFRWCPRCVSWVVMASVIAATRAALAAGAPETPSESG